MAEKIWSHGKYWATNEYNRRLSKENKIIFEYEKKSAELDKEEEEKINKVWQ